MTPRDFAFWLRGYFELAGEGPLSEEQVKLISDHLKLAMTKVTKPTKWPTPEDWDREHKLMEEEYQDAIGDIFCAPKTYG